MQVSDFQLTLTRTWDHDLGWFHLPDWAPAVGVSGLVSGTLLADDLSKVWDCVALAGSAVITSLARSRSWFRANAVIFRKIGRDLLHCCFAERYFHSSHSSSIWFSWLHAGWLWLFYQLTVPQFCSLRLRFCKHPAGSFVVMAARIASHRNGFSFTHLMDVNTLATVLGNFRV